MAELVGLTLGVAALVPIVIEVIEVGHKYADEIRLWNEDAKRLALKMSMHISTTELMYNVLFKEPAPGCATLFQKLSDVTKTVVSSVLIEFHDAMILKYRALQAAYGLNPPSPWQSTQLAEPRERNNIRFRISWVLWGKRKVEAVVKECEYWNEKLWALLQIQITGDLPLSHGPWPAVTVPPPQLEPLSKTEDVEKLGLKNDLEIAKISYQPARINSLEWQALDLDILKLEGDDTGPGDTSTPQCGRLDGRRVILDLKWFTPDPNQQDSSHPEEAVLDRIRQLAALLSKRHSHMQRARLLECVGLYHLPDRHAFSYVFKFPNACFGSPISLRELHSRKAKALNPHMPPFENRLHLALVLAVALFQFHAVGWIHKSFRSSNVIFIPDDEAAAFPDLTQPWLVGFEYAREDPGFSELMPVNVAHDIYRHPDNWGAPTTKFQKIHDIYSLGVVLLEIGLWKSAFQLEKLGFRNVQHSEREEVQQLFIAKAKTELPFYVGSVYSSVVVKCLTGRFDAAGLNCQTRATHSSYQEQIVEALRKISFQADVDAL